MTFEYLNRAFGLPLDYLQTTLTITDSHYPYLSIARYAHEKNVNEGAFLGQVQAAVRGYTTAPH